MSIQRTVRPALIAGACLAAPALAQSNIDASNKYSWGENVGFFNWRDANSASQGAVLGAAGFKGYVWGENVGWVHLGAAGGPYANTNNTNYGVNRAAGGLLSGFAWGENIGWINFGVHASLPAAQQARYDSAARRLRGYAWGENIGWMNLDDATKFVGLKCCVDYNNDEEVDFSDIEMFLAAYAAQIPGNCAPGADWNGDEEFDFSDIETFIAAYSAGC